MEVLKEIIGKDDDGSRNNLSTASDLLSIFDNLLFFWDHKNQKVHAINLNFEKSGKLGPKYQTLLLTSPPLDAVTQLLVSPDGRRLALVSSGGVTVVELPCGELLGRGGRDGLFEGGQQQLASTSRQLAERFFMCFRHVEVTKVRWHPESATDSHLVVLCTDNYLRVYDVSVDIQTPSHVLALGATQSATLGGGLGDSFVRSLGEVAVSFAFGPRLGPAETQTAGAQEPLPVFILRGNGDIYVTCVNLASTKSRYQVSGPVAMHPAADDNYGTDACDVLCIGNSPPVLVVATPTRLYHCVVVSRPPDDGDDGVGSEASEALRPAAVSLFVYESVEPDLVMAPGEDDDPVTSPVRLHADPASDCRYFCSHAAGVHAVALPLISALDNFAAQPDDSGEPLGEHPCIVEHLVCTRSVAAAPCCPVMGLCVIPHPLMMVVLLATHEVLQLPLVTKFRPTLTQTGRAEEGAPFDEHVRQLLERSASQPLLRSATADQPVSAQQQLQLLLGAADRLRVEYVQRQQLARQVLQARTEALRQLHDQQLQETGQLQLLRGELQTHAESSAVRLVELQDKHELLTQRVELLFERCQRGVPVLSDAEKTVAREMKTMENNTATVGERLKQLAVKFEYQRKQLSVQRVNQQRQNRDLLTLSETQRAGLQTELAAQGDQIAALVRGVQTARTALRL